MKKYLILTLFIILFTAAHQWPVGEKPEFIKPSKQRVGNAQKGYDYLVNGNYLRSGLPFPLFKITGLSDTNNYLKRKEYNTNIPHDFTAVKASNGVMVVAPNCLQCHAQKFEGNLVVGIGNSLTNFTSNNAIFATIIEKILLNKKDAEQQIIASQSFIKSIKTIAPDLVAECAGVNVADRIAALLVAHRDPKTLKWSDESSLKIPKQLIPSDVPAWWLLKKKNAMFYNGFGRGDFGRFLMASNLLTVSDTIEANDVDRNFNDVLAYINSIEAPKYPKNIDANLSKTGQQIFLNNCSKCHGTYDVKESYPNLLIPANIIKTDSFLFTANYSNPQFVNWFNNSWFSSGNHPAKLVPYKGYIAPPLDGIWATAPYLHNASVPNLETLLNSSQRPKFWERSFSNPTYDYEKIGWKYETKETASSKLVYNTTIPGYGNQGHFFGDKLNDSERKALIEYLKTL